GPAAGEVNAAARLAEDRRAAAGGQRCGVAVGRPTCTTPPWFRGMTWAWWIAALRLASRQSPRGGVIPRSSSGRIVFVCCGVQLDRCVNGPLLQPLLQFPLT